MLGFLESKKFEKGVASFFSPVRDTKVSVWHYQYPYSFPFFSPGTIQIQLTSVLSSFFWFFFGQTYLCRHKICMKFANKLKLKRWSFNWLSQGEESYMAPLSNHNLCVINVWRENGRRFRSKWKWQPRGAWGQSGTKENIHVGQSNKPSVYIYNIMKQTTKKAKY